MPSPPNDSPDRLRLDKWLWAARFFKTRSLAAEAIAGGKVKVNGATAKPAREVGAGDRLDIQAHEQQWNIVVAGVNAQRRPAPEARRLYQETPESAARRAQIAEMRQLAPTPGADAKGRPTKRVGRVLRRLRDS